MERRAASFPSVPHLMSWRLWLLSLFGIGSTTATPQQLPRPKVGVGVFVRSPQKPGCILLGKRKGSTGAGTWALPGGHLEFGESWAECAAREVLEETGIVVGNVQTGTIINSVEPETNYHYVVVFMVADCVPTKGPVVAANLEPDKCEGWEWKSWNDEAFFSDANLFRTLSDVRGTGFNPLWRPSLGAVVQSPDDAFPPYCCCILTRGADGDLLLEQRDGTAAVAAGKLTCFGGKRESAEPPLACIQRELREELGYDPMGAAAAASASLDDGGIDADDDGATYGFRRAVDLYVDGKLIAWFFEAAAPGRNAPLVYEKGRSGVWLRRGGIGDDVDAVWRLVSPWHQVVLEAWVRGERRADYISG